MSQKPSKERTNTSTIIIRDMGNGKVSVKLNFKKAIGAKDLLTSGENLAFDALKFIKNQQG